MANMSYCRFENTLQDLEDCYEHLSDDLSDSKYEQRARERLIQLCYDITNLAESLEDEEAEDEDAYDDEAVENAD